MVFFSSMFVFIFLNQRVLDLDNCYTHNKDGQHYHNTSLLSSLPNFATLIGSTMVFNQKQPARYAMCTA
uniref:Uncharacterized protein n=1 Tax=Anopheles arabiensis TaxID=7173 RepID=A0A182IFC8_ANOAR